MRATRAIWIVAVLVILALGAWTRLSQLPQVFVEGEVLPASPDVYYHLHRIERSVVDFPSVPVRDAYLNWPDGGFCPWPVGFDLMGAALVKLAGTPDSEAARARVVSLLPVLLGLVLIAATMQLARRMPRDRENGTAVAVGTGLVLALTPQSISIARIARVDHHIAEVLAMLLLAGWALWGVRRHDDARTSARTWLGFEIVGAAIALWSGAVFNGSILYMTVAGLLLAGSNLLRGTSTRTWATRALGSGGPAFLAAGLLLTPLNQRALAVHGHRLAYEFPSLLQPLLFVAAGVGLLAAGLVTALGRQRASWPRRLLPRVLSLGAGCVAAAIVTWLVLPGLAGEVWAGAAGWVAAKDPWLSGINEFQPLSWHNLERYWGVFGILAAITVPMGLARAWREDRGLGAFLLAWTLMLLPIACLQSRFTRVFLINLAILWGFALLWSGELLLSRWRDRRSRVPLLLSFCAVVPLLVGSVSQGTRTLLWLSAPRAPSSIESAGLYLRSLPRATPYRGEGVLTDWDDGDAVIWVGKRPVVAAGFGPWPGPEGFSEVQGYPRLDQAGLMELLDRRDLGFVAVGSGTFSALAEDPADRPFVDAPGGGRQLNTAFFRARPLAPLVLGGTGMPRLGVRHLERLRPRFASLQAVRGLRSWVPLLWVYERVPGAEIHGDAPPGRQVLAVLDYTVRGRNMRYRAFTRGDESGRFKLVLPLPSGSSEPGFVTAPRYSVTVGDGPARPVEVPEQAVVSGGVLEL